MKEVGRVVVFYKKKKIAVIEITSDNISIGDIIYFKPSCHKQKIESMQIDMKNVDNASIGDAVAILLDSIIEENERVFLV
jgi:translation elongation factor EF-1alpha